MNINKNMLNPPNSFSFMRAPLALLFIIENGSLRATVVFLAMLTDCIDGYLARRYQCNSRFGAILDPIMDKFFVYVALGVLLYEDRLTMWQATMMLSRDFFLFLFLLYLGLLGLWKTMEFKAIRWGKVTTAAQFCLLISLALKLPIPSFFYFSFIFFGIFAFLELVQRSKTVPAKETLRK